MENWSGFSLILMAAVVSSLLPAGLAVISRLLRPKIADAPRLQPKIPEATVHGKRLNIRFFLGASLFLPLLAIFLLLVPGVIALRGDRSSWAAAVVVVVSALTLLVLVYAARKGDIDWIRSFRNDDREEP